MILYILIVIFIIYLFKYKTIEKFTSSFNSFTVDETYIIPLEKPSFKTKTITIQEENEFIIKSIESKTTLDNFDGVSFTDIAYFVDFPLEDEFKNFILRFVNSLSLMDRTGKTILFAIPLKLSDIKFAKGCKSTICYYLFKCELINQNLNIPQSFKVCIKVDGKHFFLIYIKRLVEKGNLSVKGIDNLNNDSLFRTKNTLFLMDPFLTSSNDI